MNDTSLFKTGIRPAVDEYLKNKSEERRDYGEFWSASSAGYCMRKLIFERLGVPPVKDDARKTRVFEVGHVFHAWLQDITKEAGISIAQEVELQDEELMIRGHIDDLVLVKKDISREVAEALLTGYPLPLSEEEMKGEADHLILYDYKTQNSRAFSYKRPNMSHFHRMQLGTYMYMLRRSLKPFTIELNLDTPSESIRTYDTSNLTEARILKISKDDLRMSEEQLLWTPKLEKDVYEFWSTLNGYWKAQTIPACTCADHEAGFMSRPQYNPFYYNDAPCSMEWMKKCKDEGLLR